MMSPMRKIQRLTTLTLIVLLGVSLGYDTFRYSTGARSNLF